MANELLVRFATGTNVIDGESQAVISSDDTLISDFTTGKFSDVQDFSLGMDLDESDSGSAMPLLPPAGLATLAGGRGPLEPRTTAIPKHSKTPFASWVWGKDGKPLTAKQLKEAFPVNFEPFALSKQFDRASPQLFETIHQIEYTCVAAERR